MISPQKKTHFHIIILIFLLLFIPTIHPSATPDTWDEEYSFVQKIEIPLDTSKDHAKHQPVDMSIEFDQSCWAKNENHHSIRVCCQWNNQWYELESQIYNLKSIETEYISSCDLVFLIPKFADGTEEYYLFYDDSEKPPPEYIDHVQYQESSYHYEPIPGYPLQSEYYEIRDDDFISYMISYAGEFMGYNTCQHVYKMIEGTTEIIPKNAELFAAFDYKYCYDDGLFDYSSTSQHLISKEVVTDGNLMIEIGIVSTSKFNDLKTTATYKYYHCPTSDKRIHVHVFHETLKEINVYDQARTDGAFASLQAGGVKSRSIDELNIGRILPWMHFTNEMNTTSEYPLDVDPEYIQEDPDIRVISIHDDIDLGQNPWISFDEGKTGKNHALIFNSDSIVQSGTQEKDGIQVNAFQMDYPHLSGLENNIATVQAGRNSIEPGQDHDLTIPNNLVIEYDAAFFSSESKGYQINEEETSLFQNLVEIKPSSSNDYNQESTKKEEYDLSVLVYHAPSIPMGSTLSAALGLNLSYITVELYKNNNFISSQNAVRVPLNALEEIEDPSLFRQLVSFYKMFDLTNSSIFKKAFFSGIEMGTYVVKIFRENPLISNQREYVGCSIVELDDDTLTQVLCRKESLLNLSVVDQNQEGVKNVDVQIQISNQTVSSSKTNGMGQTTISVPSNPKDYILKVKYNNDVLFEESVKLNYIRSVVPLKKTISIERYLLHLQIIDNWNQPLGIGLKPILQFKESISPNSIEGKRIKENEHVFTNLTPNTYVISLKYKNFLLNETIKISEETHHRIDFPAEFKVTLNILDKRGSSLKGPNVIVRRNDLEKEFINIQSHSSIQLPPGNYQIDILNQDQIIGSRSIQIYGEKNFDILTSQEPLIPLIVTIAISILIILSFIYLWLSHKKEFMIILLIISLLLISLYLPWWEINGSTDDVESTTQLFLIPSNMVTLYETESGISGESSYLPPEFQDALLILIVLTISVCIIIGFTEYATQKKLIKRVYQTILSILSITMLLMIIIGFLVALNELCSISIGSIFGSGIIETGIPGKTGAYALSSSWGPSVGFYLLLISTVLHIIPKSYNIINQLRK